MLILSISFRKPGPQASQKSVGKYVGEFVGKQEERQGRVRLHENGISPSISRDCVTFHGVVKMTRMSFRDCPIRPLSHLSVCRLCLKLRQDDVTQWLQRVDLAASLP